MPRMRTGRIRFEEQDLWTLSICNGNYERSSLLGALITWPMRSTILRLMHTAAVWLQESAIVN